MLLPVPFVRPVPVTSGVTSGNKTVDTVAALLCPPMDDDVAVVGCTGGNLEGRAVDVIKAVGGLVISHGGMTGRCVLGVVSWLSSTH